jgi:hypothetical protein
MFKKLSVIAAFIFMSGLMTSGASASPVTFEFTGFVYEVIDPVLTNTFSENQGVSGSYTFESTTLATYPNIFNPNAVDYHGLLSMSLNIGGYTATYNPSSPSTTGMIRISDNNVIGDSYQVWGGMSGASSSGIPLDFFVIGLDDYSGLALSSLALPADASQLSAFPNGQFQLSFTEYLDPLTMVDHAVYGEITSIKTSPVPLPGALLLFMSGFGPITAFGLWRKLRRPA